jgi:hypothetical protein
LVVWATLRTLPNQVLARLDELELELGDLALPEAHRLDHAQLHLERLVGLLL